MPIAVIAFQFDPYAQLFGELTVRWSTIALAAVIVAALLLAGMLARGGGLRPDDVIFVAVGIVPGAVIGGRIGYLLVHADAYRATPERWVDPAFGGLELGLAVVGGLLTGAYVASLLGASPGRWLHLAAVPVLFVLGAGKLTMVLSGSGQGQPSGADWATAYLGPGPWGSLAPALPSVPSQAFEGIATLVILAALALMLMIGLFDRRDGRLFFLAIGLWALARAAVSTTWRDPTVTGSLGVAGWISVSIAIGCAVVLAILIVRGRRPVPQGSPAEEPLEVAWPDPEVGPTS